MTIQLYIAQDKLLPDSGHWQHRFEIQSESSNRLYVVAQHKAKKHWACSCPGWKRYQHCKHLDALRLPGHEQPQEVQPVTQDA